MKLEQIYLSRKNLLILLSKLDRLASGEETTCTIVKFIVPGDELQNTANVMITAVEDEELYANRNSGTMLSIDEERIKEKA